MTKVDALLENLIGMCLYGRCPTVRARSEYCTPCEAAARLTDLTQEHAQLKAVLEEFDRLPERMVDLLRRNGYVFERFPRNLIQEPPEGDGEKWEAMAFSLYTELMHVASTSRSVLVVEPPSTDEKADRDNRKQFSQLDMDHATKPLHAEIERLKNAVMLAIVSIDCERNGLTPDGNVRERLVGVLAE